MAKRTIRERWRKVPGHPGYEVSDQGRVRSLDREVWSRRSGGRLYRRFYRGKMLSPRLNTDGYRVVTMGNLWRDARVPCLVLLAFRGPPPRGMEACHRDGVKSDDRLSNLKYDTHRNNLRDRAEHGTDPKGERHWMSKLTERDVRAIRRSLLRQSSLAKKYGVSRSNISHVQTGQTWGWLK